MYRTARTIATGYSWSPTLTTEDTEDTEEITTAGDAEDAEANGMIDAAPRRIFLCVLRVPCGGEFFFVRLRDLPVFVVREDDLRQSARRLPARDPARQSRSPASCTSGSSPSRSSGTRP